MLNDIAGCISTGAEGASRTVDAMGFVARGMLAGWALLTEDNCGGWNGVGGAVAAAGELLSPVAEAADVEGRLANLDIDDPDEANDDGNEDDKEKETLA